MAGFEWAEAGPDDVERLVALRLEVMRESLERIGRFHPDRARAWFVASFRPEHMRLILADGVFAGCVALRPDGEGGLWLEHFYLRAERQGQGLGAAVMDRLMAEADAVGAPVRLTVLRESPANRFYPRWGFAPTHVEGVDIHYRRPARTLAPP